MVDVSFGITQEFPQDTQPVSFAHFPIELSGVFLVCLFVFYYWSSLYSLCYGWNNVPQGSRVGNLILKATILGSLTS